MRLQGGEKLVQSVRQVFHQHHVSKFVNLDGQLCVDKILFFAIHKPDVMRMK